MLQSLLSELRLWGRIIGGRQLVLKGGMMNQVTQILNAIDQGDEQATNELLPLVYEELRRLAAQHLAQEAPGQTLQPTALVHEAYLRLVGDVERTAPGDEPRWQGRNHFFAAAAEAMRRILIENARRKRSQKRGGGWHRHELEPDLVAGTGTSHDLLDLDEALGRLIQLEPQVAELVKLRYFAGLTIPQAAAAMGIAPRTADSWWAYARAWLLAELHDETA
jgi:RNA polymerase sigma factor (TIGR02999 family)